MSKDEENTELLSETDIIRRMAANGFTMREMALQLGYDYRAFKQQALTVDSDIWTAIESGKMESEFTIIDKQRQLAEAGNITAAQTFKNMTDQKKIEQIKERIWFGSD